MLWQRHQHTSRPILHSSHSQHTTFTVYVVILAWTSSQSMKKVRSQWKYFWSVDSPKSRHKSQDHDLLAGHGQRETPWAGRNGRREQELPHTKAYKVLTIHLRSEWKRKMRSAERNTANELLLCVPALRKTAIRCTSPWCHEGMAKTRCNTGRDKLEQWESREEGETLGDKGICVEKMEAWQTL